jgi:hypothetical protein
MNKIKSIIIAVAKNTKREYKLRPKLFMLYFILRLTVIIILIAQLQNGDYHNVLLCVLTLILFSIPSFVEKTIKVDVPDTLEVIILIFIFAAEILGEIREYYVNVPHWDLVLHTVTGFLCAAIGLALIDILNRSKLFHFDLSPFFVAFIAFCFSMTIGVLWEFFEFFMDTVFRFDMQKDTVLNSISSVTIHEGGRNIPVIIDNINKTVISGTRNGVPVEIVINGYLDLGLLDTMKDLIVNFVGALVFSVIGYFYIKLRGTGKGAKFVRRFILTKIEDDPPENPEERQNPDSESEGDKIAEIPAETVSKGGPGSSKNPGGERADQDETSL